MSLRTETLRIASELPEGDETRRALLAALKTSGKGVEALAEALLKTIQPKLREQVRFLLVKVAHQLGHTPEKIDVTFDDTYGIYVSLLVENAPDFGRDDAAAYSRALGGNEEEWNQQSGDRGWIWWRFDLPNVG